MNKKQIQALVNKGAVTVCGLQDSEKIEKMDEQAFFNNYVGQNGLQEMRSEDAGEVEEVVETTTTPDPDPEVTEPIETPEVPETTIEEVIAPQVDIVGPAEAPVVEPVAEPVEEVAAVAEEVAPAPAKKSRKK